MHQVVLDTNVLVAALRSKLGASHQLIQMMGLGVFQANISVAVVLEYEDVFQRKGLLPGMNRTDVDAFLDYLCKASNRVPFVRNQRPNLRDPNDECILEVALWSRASIITHNTRDFAGVERFGVSVQTPGQFLRALRIGL